MLQNAALLPTTNTVLLRHGVYSSRILLTRTRESVDHLLELLHALGQGLILSSQSGELLFQIGFLCLEILDQALLRAGRFDRQVLVDRPDKTGRLEILKVHVKKITLAQGVDLEQVAALTTGFSGADLANLVNEAALNATRRKAQAVELQDFTAAIERIVVRS